MAESYVGRFLKKSGNGLYLGGAGASILASIPFAQKYRHVFEGLDWTGLTEWVKYPWTAIGAGQLGKVLGAYERDKTEGVKPHWLEHTGRVLRPANLASVPIASATDDNGLYALALTGGLTAAGYILENVGSWLRKRNS